jgi:hypothetical protein
MKVLETWKIKGYEQHSPNSGNVTYTRERGTVDLIIITLCGNCKFQK